MFLISRHVLFPTTVESPTIPCSSYAPIPDGFPPRRIGRFMTGSNCISWVIGLLYSDGLPPTKNEASLTSSPCPGRLTCVNPVRSRIPVLSVIMVGWSPWKSVLASMAASRLLVCEVRCTLSSMRSISFAFFGFIAVLWLQNSQGSSSACGG